MPTVATIQATVDAEVATLRATTLNPRQTQYRSARSRHFQGILTTDLAALPNNTDRDPLVTVAPNLRRRPTDQAEDWAEFGLDVSALTYALEVHTYDGPDGVGWETRTYFRHGGRLYGRVTNVGPETYREQPWTQIGEGV